MLDKPLKFLFFSVHFPKFKKHFASVSTNRHFSIQSYLITHNPAPTRLLLNNLLFQLALLSEVVILEKTQQPDTSPLTMVSEDFCYMWLLQGMSTTLSLFYGFFVAFELPLIQNISSLCPLPQYSHPFVLFALIISISICHS